MGVQGPTGMMVSVNVAQRTDFTVWTTNQLVFCGTDSLSDRKIPISN